MNLRTVTREEVAQKLSEWASGRTSSAEVHGWASALFLSEDVDFADWEGDEDSVTKEVLGALDMMDMNLVTPQDIPALLAFLGTPVGGFSGGYEKMKKWFDSVDYAARKTCLQSDPLYAPFIVPAKR